MSKLNSRDKFLDLSDYGRAPGKMFANSISHTRITPIHVTLLFGISGLIAIFCIHQGLYWWAAFFIILKSIIDAADGELARINQTPSYTGRYLDSVFDIILNLLIFTSLAIVTKTSFYYAYIAFFAVQLQGTLYNYYYVILRNLSEGGDTTSKIFEYNAPQALPGEKQRTVTILFYVYYIVYGFFDKIIHILDPEAYKVKSFPSWFMSLLSIYGLGFQLLIIAIMLPLNLIQYIIPFFTYYSVFIFVLIGIRRFILR
jgi:phosphatidylglycerophosphate synthase